MNQIKAIPILFIGDGHFIFDKNLLNDKARGHKYVAILKSDLDRLNETEKWRQLQAQLLSVQESALTSEYKHKDSMELYHHLQKRNT